MFKYKCLNTFNEQKTHTVIFNLSQYYIDQIQYLNGVNLPVFQEHFQSPPHSTVTCILQVHPIPGKN